MQRYDWCAGFPRVAKCGGIWYRSPHAYEAKEAERSQEDAAPRHRYRISGGAGRDFDAQNRGALRSFG